MSDLFHLKKLALHFEEEIKKDNKNDSITLSEPEVISFSDTSPISNSSIPKKYLKKKIKQGITKQTVDNVYVFFRNILIKNFPKAVLPKKPMGKDVGHIKNLINFADKDIMRLKQMIVMFCKDWINAQSKWSLCTRCVAPNFYLMDTFKRDLFSCLAQGGITNGTTARHSQYAKESNYGFNEW